jgi:hypothetical protein
MQDAPQTSTGTSRKRRAQSAEARAPLHRPFLPRYIQQAPIEAVMAEQLSYLVNHGSTGCDAVCPDCARLAYVRSILLRRFDLR